MKSKNINSDKELVVLLKEGCRDAYTEIYQRYWGLLFQHAKKILQSEEAAKDVVQDIFIAIWTNRIDLNIQKKLSSYLYSAVRYKIFDLIDKGKVKGNYLQSLESFIERGEYTTDNFWLEKELAMQIEKEVNLLPPKMREVFILSREFNLSHKEIAEKLNISNQTVKKQIYNALKILRPKLGLYILLIIEILFD